MGRLSADGVVPGAGGQHARTDASFVLLSLSTTRARTIEMTSERRALAGEMERCVRSSEAGGIDAGS